MTEIYNRVLQISEYKGFKSVNEFAVKGLGYNSSERLNRLKKENTTPSFDITQDISNKFEDINMNWFLTGKGQMTTTLTLSEPPAAYLTLPDSIPLIPVEAMAGFGTAATTILEMDCERFVVPTFKGADFLIQVKGSSMEPKYNSGDIVACRKLSLRDAFFQWGKVYVLDTEQGALIKRIKKGVDKDHILVVSDNLEYDPFELHLSKMNAIAIVMGLIRLV